MDLQVPEATLAALLLGTARSTGFVLLAPPFNSTAIPKPAKAGLALALSVIVSHRIAGTLPAITTAYLLTTVVTEVAIGAALGFLVQLLFTAVQIAGDIIDLTGGFSLQPAFDPQMLTTTSTIGKLQFQLASTLLFTSGGHLLIVRGFVTSYEGLPVGAALPTKQLAQSLISAFSTMFLSALQIAGPLVAVLLLADVALALLNRAAPALNIFTLGFPVKIMITLVLLGLTYPLLPSALNALVDQGVHLVVTLKSG